MPRPLWITLIVSLLLLFLYHVLYSRIEFSLVVVTSLTRLQEEQLTTYRDMNKLLETLATLLLGALGASALNWYKTHPPTSSQLHRLFASGIFAGISLYFGYISSETVIWMLDRQFFDLTHSLLLWPHRGQFWTFLVALSYFLAFTTKAIREVDKCK